MNFNDYQAASMRTATHLDETLEANLVHASLGLSTEVGEFVTEAKRIHRYHKPCTPEMVAHMSEELGDVLWYVALAASALGVPMSQIASDNVAKLQKRFPEKYTNEAAEARADKEGASARVS